MEHPWLLLLFAGLAGGVGVLWLSQYFAGLRRQRAARAWPTAQGQILHARLREEQDPSLEGDRTETVWVPQVTYRYWVAGREYQGHALTLQQPPTFSTRRRAEQFLAHYRPGQRVTVYYNPLFPLDAVLQPALPSGFTLHLVGGALFLALGVGLGYWALQTLLR